MSVNISYLIPDVRLMIGDLDSTAYRYLDEWLLNSLILSVKSIRRYLGAKYLVDNLGNVSRDDTSVKFTVPETSGIIEMQDEYLLALKASIIVLEGNLESSAWSLTSWRDSEYSVSNQETSRTKNDNLARLLGELNELVVSPSKRLARAVKGSLPGYLNNIWEHKTEF
jgi:hypothetical protein